ncbi:unnamed protein product [Acanthosepion pharaonis]|uniref:EGF-like domain-containing protein n=1 Tax=Acanthosepion pharaonis TaxID=158019 RepID=A0A812AQU8_ACAPH|nr:unnamed protein product [Sepia pharaonis]
MTSLQDCNNHEMNEKCSTWEMIDPCLNGGTLINNICVCPLPYKGVRCQFYQPVSCLEICQMSLNKNQTVVSQMYFLYTSTQKRIEVFCDFKNETFGTMFIPRSSLFQLTQSEFKEFVPDSKEFIFRERLDNQEENEAIISTLPSFQGQPWTITLRADTTKFDLLPQEPKSPYIYIGGIPRDKIAEAKKFISSAWHGVCIKILYPSLELLQDLYSDNKARTKSVFSQRIATATTATTKNGISFITSL